MAKRQALLLSIFCIAKTVHIVAVRLYSTIAPFYDGKPCIYNSLKPVNQEKTSNSSLKTRGAAASRTRITWASFLGSEEPLLKLLRSAKLQRTNFSPISNCRRSKSAIFLSSNIKLQYKFFVAVTRRNTYYIYIIYRALHTGSRNENNKKIILYVELVNHSVFQVGIIIIFHTL